VEATRLLMRQYTDETDNLLIARGDTLLVPPALEETAWEIVNASGKMDTAENNPNFNKGKYKIIVWDYLTESNAEPSIVHLGTLIGVCLTLL
jgi:phage major head subunit gpT-like protein